MGCNIHLPENIIRIINDVWERYLSDVSRVSRRARALKYDYIIPKMQGVPSNDLPNFQDILQQYMSIDSDPPELTRIVRTGYTGPFIWGQKEISAVMGRNTSTVSRIIDAMEKCEWKQKLDVCREKLQMGKTEYYMYSDDIFKYILQYIARNYISSRIISPRHGNPLSERETEEVWEYWESLNQSFYEPTAENEINDCFSLIPPDAVEAHSFSDTTPTFRDILIDCKRRLLDHKALAVFFGLLVNCADIAKSTERYVFYLIPPVLLFTTICSLIRLKHLTTDRYNERSRINQLIAYILLASVVWVLCFAFRVVNGDLTKSGVTDTLNNLSNRVKQIEISQQKNDQKINQLNISIAALEEQKEKEQEANIIQAAETAHQATLFAQNAVINGNAADQEFKDMIQKCDEILSTLPIESYPQRASLLLAMSDVYIAWGHVSAPQVSKLTEARICLQKIEKMQGYIPPDLIVKTYINMGQSYINEGDIRNKDEMLRHADEYYTKVVEYIDSVEQETQMLYYYQLGVLKTAQSETLRGREEYYTEGKKLLIDSLMLLDKSIALSTDNDMDYMFSFILNNKSIAVRQLLDLQLHNAKNDAEIIATCNEALINIDDAIKALNIETQQLTYAFLNLNKADIIMQIWTSMESFGIMNNNRLYLDTILTEALNSLSQAGKFISSNYKGIVLGKKAMVLYRIAVMSNDKADYQKSIAAYDEALQALPENSNLQQNMYMAANKAVTLLTAGLKTHSDEFLEQAYKLSTYYLHNYSTTCYKDILNHFQQIVDLLKS